MKKRIVIPALSLGLALGAQTSVWAQPSFAEWFWISCIGDRKGFRSLRSCSSLEDFESMKAHMGAAVAILSIRQPTPELIEFLDAQNDVLLTEMAYHLVKQMKTEFKFESEAHVLGGSAQPQSIEMSAAIAANFISNFFGFGQDLSHYLLEDVRFRGRNEEINTIVKGSRWASDYGIITHCYFSDSPQHPAFRAAMNLGKEEQEPSQAKLPKWLCESLGSDSGLNTSQLLKRKARILELYLVACKSNQDHSRWRRKLFGVVAEALKPMGAEVLGTPASHMERLQRAHGYLALARTSLFRHSLRGIMDVNRTAVATFYSADRLGVGEHNPARRLVLRDGDRKLGRIILSFLEGDRVGDQDQGDQEVEGGL